MAFSLEKTVAVLKENASALPFDDETTRNEFIGFLEKQIGRGPDDHRKAVEIAVDAAKVLVAIATAFFVAVGAFLQYGMKEGIELWDDDPAKFLFYAAVALLASMAMGIKVIGNAYKRAANIIKGVAWSVASLRWWLGGQVIAGLIACVLFGLAILSWNSEEYRTRNTVDGLIIFPREDVDEIFNLSQEVKRMRRSLQEASEALAQLQGDHTSSLNQVMQELESLEKYTNMQWKNMRRCLQIDPRT